jgi:ribosome-binding factor A
LVLEKPKRRSTESEFVDADLAEGLYEADSGGRSSDRQAQRKARQLCRQVERALNLAFADRDGEDDLGGLFVDEVTPAPDGGRLLVHVVIPADRPAAGVILALRHESPRLRSEVAAAVTRKRAPELSFIPASPEGSSYE